ncbi:unnamed protein product [Calypogeia fissa]
MLEEQTGVVCIDDTYLDIMRVVIRFCYDAEIDFCKVPAEEVLQAAHKYDIVHLQKLCEKDLADTITYQTLPKRLTIAKLFELTDLKEVASQFFQNNLRKFFRMS